MSPSIDWPVSCPHCAAAADVVYERGRVRGVHCTSGHRFDAARQGYVNLSVGRGSPLTPDTAEMVMARERVQNAGVFDALSKRLAAIVPSTSESVGADHAPTPSPAPGIILDVGAGTGHYLHRILDHRPGACGIAMDLSPAGLKRAAKHDRALALGWDIWRCVPLADHSADVVLCIFAPRNPAEFARVLSPGGLAIVVTPRPGHLRELADVGLLAHQPQKHGQLLEQMRAELGDPHHVTRVSESLTVEAATAADLVFMGPAGHHRTHPQILAEVQSLVGISTITTDLDVTVWSR